MAEEERIQQQSSSTGIGEREPQTYSGNTPTPSPTLPTPNGSLDQQRNKRGCMTVSSVCICLFAASLPFLVCFWALVLHPLMPASIQSGFEGAFVSGVKYAFRLHAVDYFKPKRSRLAPIFDPGIFKGKGAPPRELCGSYFMLGDPSPGGVVDWSQGSWEASTRTLTMSVTGRRQWSFNDNFEGVRLFYSAYLLQLQNKFVFNENFTAAVITSPALFGLIDLSTALYGAGSTFTMTRGKNAYGVDTWTRRSLYANGTEVIPPVEPLRFLDCDGHFIHGHLARIVKTMKDHPEYSAEAPLQGGAVYNQLVRL